MIRLIIGIFFLCTLSSCATIFTGTKGKIHISSEPADAEVYSNGVLLGKTPCSVELSRGVDWNNDMVLGRKIELRKKGYQTQYFIPESKFNGLAILNLFQFYFWAVDIMSGAMWVYNPTDYKIVLLPEIN